MVQWVAKDWHILCVLTTSEMCQSLAKNFLEIFWSKKWDFENSSVKMTQMRPIWVRREMYCWDWYKWDAWTRVCSDMTETPSLPLTLIWLRRLDPILHRYDWDAPNFFHRYFWVCRSLKCVESKSENKIFWASQSYVCNRKDVFHIFFMVSDLLSPNRCHW